jgi:hypothetical protein
VANGPRRPRARGSLGGTAPGQRLAPRRGRRRAGR